MIVITTPTGRIGRQVLDEVLGPEAVRVIARDPARLPPHVHERAEVVPGTHDDPEVLAEAFAGADSVFWVVPPNPGAGSVAGHYRDFTRPACDAIRSQGVRRVVGVSTLGRGITEDTGHLWAALAADELIEATGVAYRALRPPTFMENLLNQVQRIRDDGVFVLPNSGDRVLRTVATRDIAAAAVRLLLDDSWSGQDGVAVIGPDDLRPGEMARTMSEVLERPVRFQHLGGAEYKAAMMRYGMSDAWAQGLVDMAAAQDAGVYDDEPRTPAPATGFRRWCEDVLRPAVLA